MKYSQPFASSSADDVDHVGVEARDERAVAAVARHAVDVLPAVALADPQERRPLSIQRTSSTTSTQVFDSIAKDARHLAGAGVGEQEVVPVLQPVQLLDRERAAVEPLQAREIVFRGSPGVFIHVVSPPSALTTPMRTAEFVVPTFGYGICVIVG